MQLPDEYDQIVRLDLSPHPGHDDIVLTLQNKDLTPFHALTPSQIQTLVRTASSKSGMYTISCPGAESKLPSEKRECTFKVNTEGLNAEGKKVANMRVEAQMGLLRDVAAELEEVQAVFYSHDVPWQFVGHEYVSRTCGGTRVRGVARMKKGELIRAEKCAGRCSVC